MGFFRHYREKELKEKLRLNPIRLTFLLFFLIRIMVVFNGFPNRSTKKGKKMQLSKLKRRGIQERLNTYQDCDERRQQQQQKF